MVFDRFGDLSHLVYLTSNCPAVPAFKPSCAILASGGKVNILQGQLEEISSGSLEPVVAGKSGIATETNFNIKALVLFGKFNALNLSRRSDAKSYYKQRFRIYVD